MTDNRGDFVAAPWWLSSSDDYTKHRTGDIGYTVDDIIGRKDTNKFTLTTNDPTSVSGTSGTVLR